MKSVGIKVNICMVGKIIPTYNQKCRANGGHINNSGRTFDNFMRALNADIRRHLQIETLSII
jgi:hypothetical protein